MTGAEVKGNGIGVGGNRFLVAQGRGMLEGVCVYLESQIHASVVQMTALCPKEWKPLHMCA